MSPSRVRADRPSLASFWHDLPTPGKWLLSTIIVDFIGNGLVLPFSVVYLHEVRGFPLTQVGVLLAVPAVVGLVVVGPGGIVIDRVGARVVVIAATAGMMLAQVGLALSTTPVMAGLVLAVEGAAGGVLFPAISSLVAAVMPSAIRQRYFGLGFTLLNLGIGIGGILGGLFVDVHRPSTFVTVYLVDAATFLLPLTVYLVPLRHVSGRPATASYGHHVDGALASSSEGTPATYRRLLATDRALWPVLVLTFVATFIGYAQLSTGVPAFGRAEAGISTQVLGWAFTANTVVIVCLQLFVLQHIEGRRRTRALMLMTAIWVVAFVALGLSGVARGSLLSGLLFGVCLAVFGFGEMFYQPTAPAMLNDLAPDHLRGRYNAMMSFSWQCASIVGPPVAGVLVGHGLGSLYVAVLVVGCGVVAALALHVERRISPAVNGLLGRAAGPGPDTPPETPPEDATSYVVPVPGGGDLQSP